MAKVLITGANRGLGLEFVRQYLANGDFVFAACRNPGSAIALKNLKESFPSHLSISKLDVADEYSISRLATKIGGETETLDILINNAGVASWCSAEETSIEDMVRVYQTNVAGLVAMTRTFIPLLKEGEQPKIVNITSMLGSIGAMEELENAGSISYNASKAAVNMVSRKFALSLKEDGIIVLAQAPGWAKTDMGGEDAQITPEASVKGMMKVISGATMEHSGHFFEWDGRAMSW